MTVETFYVCGVDGKRIKVTSIDGKEGRTLKIGSHYVDQDTLYVLFNVAKGMLTPYEANIDNEG